VYPGLQVFLDCLFLIAFRYSLTNHNGHHYMEHSYM
jgi:hypothetical protein